MKRRSFFWCGLLVGLVALLVACSGQPQISVAENWVDLGDVVNGKVIQQEVSIQNNGQSDLIIEAVSTSCGCIQAAIEPTTIPPNGQGTLSINFDSGAHGPELTGRLVRQIFIATNDPQQPEFVIELKANILPADDSS